MTVLADTARRLRARLGDRDDGRAIIEVVVLAVLILIPTVYILTAFLRVQSVRFAMTQAARDAGRLMDSAPSAQAGVDRATAAARVALADQGVPSDTVAVRFVRAGAQCVGPDVAPDLSPGATFDICVSTIVTLPGVPSIVTGDRNSVTGVFTLHVGEFREDRGNGECCR